MGTLAWEQRQWDVLGLSTGGRGMGARWDGERGTGPAPHPGLQVLSLVFCLNEAAALNVVHSLQPTADPCQILSPGAQEGMHSPIAPISSQQSLLLPGGCRDAVLPPEYIRVSLLPQPHLEGKIQSVLSLSFFPWPHELALPSSPEKGPEGEGLDGSGINAQLPHGQWHHLLLMSCNNIVNTHWEIIISYKRRSSLWFEPGLVSNTCFY